MFQGSLPAPFLSVIAETAKGWKGKEVYVGCSGNFTIERGLAGEFPLHSNDVTLYSCSLGAYFAGLPFRVRVKDSRFEWLEDYLDEPASRTATILICSSMFMGLKQQNRYYERMREGYRAQWKDLHARTLEKVEAVNLQLKSFFAGDVLDYLLDVPDDAVFLSFPPFYCLAPNERILTADLRWLPCGDLKVGDRIVAFDEQSFWPGKRNWHFATITRSEPAVKECVKVHLRNGDSVVCTADHPWLAQRALGSGSLLRQWVRADRLLGGRTGGRPQPPQSVLRAFDTWESATSYEAGWLAGMFDGEGSLHFGPEAVKLALSQVPGPILDQVVERLVAEGFKAGVYGRGAHSAHVVDIRGGFAEQLRLLGTLRPSRLLSKLILDGRGVRATPIPIEAVEPLGLQEIQSISTSIGTYVGEGYLMHNSGGYENMFAGLESVFSWDEPDYQIMDDERLEDLFKTVAVRDAWLVGTNLRRPELEPFLRAEIQATKPSVPMFVYSSKGRTHYVRPSDIECEPVPLPRLGPGERLGESLGLVPLNQGQFAMLRNQYLVNVVNVATPALACAVTVDGVLVGVFGSDYAQFQRDAAYIKSDFAIGPTDYPRLSKLVLYALMSHEVRLLLEQAASRRINSLFTRVFSAHPVSMKYRGLFDLTSREEQEDGSYRLSYRAPAGQWSLAEGYRLWKEKHGNSN